MKLRHFWILFVMLWFNDMPDDYEPGPVTGAISGVWLLLLAFTIGETFLAVCKIIRKEWIGSE